MAKLLLVEANDMSRDLLDARLQRRGYQVVTAVDGMEAIARARVEGPDLILMDLGLPVIDGWEAIRRLRADPVTSSIPIIALVPRTPPDDQERARVAECDDYATKPIELLRLLLKIERLLARR